MVRGKPDFVGWLGPNSDRINSRVYTCVNQYVNRDVIRVVI